MKNLKIFLAIALLSIANMSFAQHKDSTNTEISRLEDKASMAIIKNLQGQIPDSTQTNSKKIRFGSPTGNKEPLFIVDGKPTNEEDFRALDPTQIASIQVLKDPASTSIYGVRGSHGVIIITTKAAETKKDKPKKK